MMYDEMKEKQEFIVENWKEDGKKVIETIWKQEKRKMKVNEFLDNCSCCGGNWAGMLLTGIKRLYPEVYNAIPNSLGKYAFILIVNVIELLEIDCSE